MQSHITELINHLRAIGYAPGTLYSYARYFRPFLAWLKTQGIDSPEQITPDILNDYQQYLYHDYSPDRSLSLGYQLNLLKILKPLFRRLMTRGVILSDPSTQLTLPRLPRCLPRSILTSREIRKLFSLPDIKTPSGVRDRLVFELLYATAVRRTELLNISLLDIDTTRREIFIRQGKGGKDRVIPLPKKTAERVEDYIRHTRPKLLGDKTSESLLINDRSTPYNRGNLEYLMKKTLARAKFRKRVTPHSFRHTCATHLLRNRADIRAIQELLGHETLTATERYTRVDIRDLKKTIDRCHPREDMDS